MHKLNSDEYAAKLSSTPVHKRKTCKQCASKGYVALVVDCEHFLLAIHDDAGAYAGCK